MDEFARVFEQAAQESLEKWNPNIDCTSLSYPQWSVLYTCSHGASSVSLIVNRCLIFSGDGTLSRIHAHQRTSTGISEDAAKLWVLSLEQLELKLQLLAHGASQQCIPILLAEAFKSWQAQAQSGTQTDRRFGTFSCSGKVMQEFASLFSQQPLAQLFSCSVPFRSTSSTLLYSNTSVDFGTGAGGVLTSCAMASLLVNE